MKHFSKISLILVVLAFFACKKKGGKDTTNPTITLNGDANMEVTQGGALTDPGATANDDKDGDISASVTSDWSSQVNGSAGSFNVTYSVSDKAGNTATATRAVTVKHSASGSYGEYWSTITNNNGTSAVFSSTVSAGGNSNQFVIYPFSAANISMVVNVGGALGDQLSYSATQFGNTYSGYGTINSSGNEINLTYTVYTGIGNYPHTSKLTKK